MANSFWFLLALWKAMQFLLKLKKGIAKKTTTKPFATSWELNNFGKTKQKEQKNRVPIKEKVVVNNKLEVKMDFCRSPLEEETFLIIVLFCPKAKIVEKTR